MNTNSSTPLVIMIQAPLSEPLKLIRVAIKPRIMPPNNAPTTSPTPPVSSVPPSTTAAIALSSAPEPASG